jgi:CubicO group peptidase (beta-lactamase class C family)
MIARFCLAAAAAVLLAVPVAATPLADLVAGRTPATPGLSGLVVVVADAQGLVRSEAFGDAVIGERPLAIATPMRVASISKLVVAIGVMRLIEAGKLDLDSDVSRWLGWRLRNPGFPDRPISLGQLLSHTAGIDDGPGYGLPLGKDIRTAIAEPAHWADATPGARFSYANLNYGVVATVMEAATGERFDTLMTRLVLAPLGLDAGYNWSGASDAAVAAAATLYRKGRNETAWDSAGPWIAQVDDLHGVRPACPVARDATGDAGCDLAGYRPGTNGTLFSPQGGLRISAPGLAKIGRMLLGNGTVDGVRLLKPRSVRALMTPVWRAGTGAIGENYAGIMLCYGPGLQCLSGKAGASDQPVPGLPGARWWGHLGEAYGLLGGVWIDREQRRVLVYLLTGTADDPAKAPHRSAFTGVEEAILVDLAATPPRRQTWQRRRRGGRSGSDAAAAVKRQQCRWGGKPGSDAAAAVKRQRRRCGGKAATTRQQSGAMGERNDRLCNAWHQ